MDGQTIGTAPRTPSPSACSPAAASRWSRQTHKPVRPVEFLTKGFVHDKKTFEGCTAGREGTRAVEADKIDDIAEIEQIVVDTVTNHLRRTYRREPAVMARRLLSPGPSPRGRRRRRPARPSPARVTAVREAVGSTDPDLADVAAREGRSARRSPSRAWIVVEAPGDVHASRASATSATG